MKKKTGDYVIEDCTDFMVRKIKVDKLYYKGRTKFQKVHCFYNEFLGKTLFLNDQIQSAQVDEFVYHETLVHPALFVHPLPKDVLVIGGGEGATLREVLRHPTVENVTMVDIDKELVKICDKYMPEWSDGAFVDNRTELIFGDARKFVEKTGKKYDVIISDLSEPLEKAPSLYLFTTEFFEKIAGVLKGRGIFVLQAGSTDPYNYNFFSSCAKTLEAVFPVVRPFWTYVSSFGLPWGFVLASNRIDPLEVGEEQLEVRQKQKKIQTLKFYQPSLHAALFVLPVYLEEALQKGHVITKKNPFIWEM